MSLESQTLRHSTFSVSPNGTESKDRVKNSFLKEELFSGGMRETEGGNVKVHTHCSPFGLLTSSVIRLNHC